MTQRPISFDQAKAAFVHRFTCEHVPRWSRIKADNGKYHAPQFVTDREWYAATRFHGESPLADQTHCYTTGQTWPLGQWLDSPYNRIERRQVAS